MNIKCGIYLMPHDHGADTMAPLFGEPKPRAAWIGNLASMRTLLYQKLRANTRSTRFQCIKKPLGNFLRFCLRKDMVESLPEVIISRWLWNGRTKAGPTCHTTYNTLPKP
jgi:aspartate/tyrosine/aromatic aminotransferase